MFYYLFIILSLALFNLFGSADCIETENIMSRFETTSDQKDIFNTNKFIERNIINIENLSSSYIEGYLNLSTNKKFNCIKYYINNSDTKLYNNILCDSVELTNKKVDGLDKKHDYNTNGLIFKYRYLNDEIENLKDFKYNLICFIYFLSSYYIIYKFTYNIINSIKRRPLFL